MVPFQIGVGIFFFVWRKAVRQNATLLTEAGLRCGGLITLAARSRFATSAFF